MRDIFELNSTDLKWLEDKFLRYNQLDREIAIRKEELKIKEVDENIGGGKANIVSSAVENQVIKEMSDPFIMQRESWKTSINRSIKEQNQDVQLLIHEKYWGEMSYMDWETVGECLGYSKSTVYRIRYKVLESFAKHIGYI
ncbi:hypothetical protein JTF06_12040 [Desemzia sp. RIT804]|uniref:hypothetical protein n=1 Tax=Desemzia sp. RIT 804 TaxID=2810209 RepID=UPI00194DC85B|nr:hypothetical protein [Desemzia sp. RIT 804]MBM6615616.1 hypothetical protein [Desemzia sp. RIT 804]